MAPARLEVRPVRLGVLVNAAADRLPFTSSCLERSVAVTWLLGRRGHRCGAGDRIAARVRPFQAHAWVDTADGPIGQSRGPAAEIARWPVPRSTTVMSAIAALLPPRRRRRRRARDPVRSRARWSERGPDHAGIWQRGPVALGHAALGDAASKIAIASADRRPASRAASIVFDGRLDARDELAESSWTSSGPNVETMSDAQLLLRAYAVRGADVFARLLGDFAFALWDAPTQQLICARDVFGLRPLFYRTTGHELVVASEIQAVLARTARHAQRRDDRRSAERRRGLA